MIEIDTLKFDEAGLIPAIIQDASTRVVLMQAYMNRESIEETLRSGKVCFFSRSRRRLWTKGEESGHFLLLQDILADCDKDSLLVKVHPLGAVCHTGKDTCWGEQNREADFLFYLAGDASYSMNVSASGSGSVSCPADFETGGLFPASVSFSNLSVSNYAFEGNYVIKQHHENGDVSYTVSSK